MAEGHSVWKTKHKGAFKALHKTFGERFGFCTESTSQFEAMVATSVSRRSEPKCEVSEQGGTTGAV